MTNWCFVRQMSSCMLFRNMILVKFSYLNSSPNTFQDLFGLMLKYKGGRSEEALQSWVEEGSQISKMDVILPDCFYLCLLALCDSDSLAVKSRDHDAPVLETRPLQARTDFPVCDTSSNGVTQPLSRPALHWYFNCWFDFCIYFTRPTYKRLVQCSTNKCSGSILRRFHAVNGEKIPIEQP